MFYCKACGKADNSKTMINEIFEIDYENDEVKITDMGAAAALYSLGWDYLRLAQTDRPGRRAFVFRRSQPEGMGSEYPPADGVFNDFVHGRLAVDAKSMWQATIDLKRFVQEDYVPEEKILKHKKIN